MIPLEHRALDALFNVTMRIASAGKRFRNDMQWNREQHPDFRLTKKQALYLWAILYTYRRQVKDPQLRRIAEERMVSGELPDIYLPGDHRELPPKAKRAERKRFDKPIFDQVCGEETQRMLF